MASNNCSFPNPYPAINIEDPFYVLRTVVFYPILREESGSSKTLESMENFVSAFGDVAEVNYLFPETMVSVPMPQDSKQPSTVQNIIGCIIVVYRTAAGAYSAVTGVEALKNHLDDASHLREQAMLLNAKALWSLVELVAIDGLFQNTDPEDSTLRHERDILVLLSDGLTVNDLQLQINQLGMSGTIEMLSGRPDVPCEVQANIPANENTPAVLVTFTRPLHAMILSACYLNPHYKVKLRIRDNNNNQSAFFFALSPVVLYSYNSSSSVHESIFESLYRNVADYYRKEIPLWQNPRASFRPNHFYKQGDFWPFCIRAVAGYFPRIIIALAMDTMNTGDDRLVPRFTYFELGMGLQPVSCRLSLPERFVSGRRSWVCCFKLEVTKRYSADCMNFDLTHRIQPMNHIFPKLYPGIFTINEHNFTFMVPKNDNLWLVNKEYTIRSQKIMKTVALKFDRRYNPRRFPCVHIVDIGNSSLEYKWTLLIIYYSDSIRLTNL